MMIVKDINILGMLCTLDTITDNILEYVVSGLNKLYLILLYYLG